jgi:hypothetical protein
MIKKAEILTVLFMVLSLWTGSLRAEIVTIYLNAEVTFVDDIGDLLEGRVDVGDTITGSYTYNSDTLDSNPLNTVGEYQHFNPPSGISFSVGGFIFKTDPDNVDFLMTILDNHNGEDRYSFINYNNLPLSSGVEVDIVSWGLYDDSSTALSSVSLPTVPPSLEDWEKNYLHITFGYKGSAYILAQVTSAVPEPATILLLALGSLIIVRRRR